MRIGYSAWGFIGDGQLDSPDGGRLTRSLFIEYLLKNDDVIWLQKNRDIENNEPIFQQKYQSEYPIGSQRYNLCKIQYDHSFPDLDVLFLEWRWKLYGRNFDVDKSSDKYTPDYDRQQELLEAYANRNTLLAIWDKDETITLEDEQYLLSKFQNRLIIFTPALYPIKHLIERRTLLFPCKLDDLKFAKVNVCPQFKIGYVGSQYERDYQVYQYINPVSSKFPVVFVGNWTKYAQIAERNKINFPFIDFKDRILPKDMGRIYSNCLTTVLLCKKNYADHGHITQRIHEVLPYGVITIGLKEQKGIDQFIPKSLIINDAYDLYQCIEYLDFMSLKDRQDILDDEINRLKPFDIENVMKTFYNTIKVN